MSDLSFPAETGKPDEIVQIVMNRAKMQAVESFLERHGQTLFPIPVGQDDLLTYGIMPKEF